MVLIHAVPAASAPQLDIEKAKRDRRHLQDELDKAVAAYEAAESKLNKTRDLLAASQISLTDSEAQVQTAQVRIGLRANLTYREGAINVFEFLFRARTLGELSRRLKIVSSVSRDDSQYLADLQKARTKTAQIRRQLALRAQEERRIVMDMSEQSDELSAKFAQAAKLEKMLVAEQQAQMLMEKQRRAQAAAAAARAKAAPLNPAIPFTKQPSPVPTLKGFVPYVVPFKTAGGMRCPVDGPTSFTDTYGFPREGGRKHQGVDMFAAYGTPTVAAADGVLLRQSSGGAGGIAVEIKAVNGTHYYYAHLSKVAGVPPGGTVSAGTTVGYVGTSGNAARTSPHLHFEIHPGGGSAINPYPAAKAACG